MGRPGQLPRGDHDSGRDWRFAALSPGRGAGGDRCPRTDHGQVVHRRRRTQGTQRLRGAEYRQQEHEDAWPKHLVIVAAGGCPGGSDAVRVKNDYPCGVVTLLPTAGRTDARGTMFHLRPC